MGRFRDNGWPTRSTQWARFFGLAHLRHHVMRHVMFNQDKSYQLKCEIWLLIAPVWSFCPFCPNCYSYKAEVCKLSEQYDILPSYLPKMVRICHCAEFVYGNSGNYVKRNPSYFHILIFLPRC